MMETNPVYTVNKVLVVDDEAETRQILKFFLEKTGWLVVTAANGEEALGLLDDSFDVVLSDIRMGQVSGIDLLRRVREQYPFIEVILVTGFVEVQDSMEALNLRAFAYLQKPFDTTEINRLLLQAVRSKDHKKREAFYKKSLEKQITDQVKQLTMEKERFQSIFSTVPCIFLVVDREHRLIDGNRQLEQFTGRTVGKMLGKRLCNILNCTGHCENSFDPVRAENCPLGRLILGLEEKDRGISRSHLSLDILSSGKRRCLSFRASCCQISWQKEMESFYLLMLDDITLEKEMESKLIQTERISALGEMAAGVAHELNQPLCGISSFLQLLQGHLAEGKHLPSEEILQIYQDLLGEVQRMSQILERLSLFSRSHQTASKKEAVDIHAVYRSSIKFLRAQLDKHGIEVKEDFEQDLPRILANSTRLEEIFINLILNARDALDALPSRGDSAPKKRIRVTAQASQREERPGILIEFADTGIGIPPEHLESVFDPFFTTKPLGKGTGLGLSISYGIIKEFGGTIEVFSEPDQETVFSLWLPACEAAG